MVPGARSWEVHQWRSLRSGARVVSRGGAGQNPGEAITEEAIRRRSRGHGFMGVTENGVEVAWGWTTGRDVGWGEWSGQGLVHPFSRQIVHGGNNSQAPPLGRFSSCSRNLGPGSDAGAVGPGWV